MDDDLDMIWPIEEYFEISLPDDAFNTLGELANAVANALGVCGNNTEANLPARAFYRTRRILVSICSADRKSIRPDTRLDAIIPKNKLQETWAQLQDEFRSLADLDLPKWAKKIVEYGFAYSLFPYVIASIIFKQWLVYMACYIATLLIFGAFSMVMRVNFGVIPKCYETVGMLAHAMIPREAVELKGEGKKLGEREIWRIVQSLVAKVVNVDPNALTRESRICDICNPPKEQAQ